MDPTATLAAITAADTNVQSIAIAVLGVLVALWGVKVIKKAFFG